MRGGLHVGLDCRKVACIWMEFEERTLGRCTVTGQATAYKNDTLLKGGGVFSPLTYARDKVLNLAHGSSFAS